LTPGLRSGDYNQAMMDLGATLCTRRGPACGHCPLAGGCRARAEGEPTRYPHPKPHRSVPVRDLRLLIVSNPAGEILLERRPPVGVWGGLWSPPECPSGERPEDWCRRRLGTPPGRLEMLPSRRHTLSHCHLDISPVCVSLDAPAVVGDGDAEVWYDPEAPAAIGLAAPIARIIRETRAGRIRDPGTSGPTTRATGDTQ
jgi:A/G-specific adenine glycosylase